MSKKNSTKKIDKRALEDALLTMYSLEEYARGKGHTYIAGRLNDIRMKIRDAVGKGS